MNFYAFACLEGTGALKTSKAECQDSIRNDE